MIWFGFYLDAEIYFRISSVVSDSLFCFVGYLKESIWQQIKVLLFLSGNLVRNILYTLRCELKKYDCMKPQLFETKCRWRIQWQHTKKTKFFMKVLTAMPWDRNFMLGTFKMCQSIGAQSRRKQILVKFLDLFYECVILEHLRLISKYPKKKWSFHGIYQYHRVSF